MKAPAKKAAAKVNKKSKTVPASSIKRTPKTTSPAPLKVSKSTPAPKKKASVAPKPARAATPTRVEKHQSKSIASGGGAQASAGSNSDNLLKLDLQFFASDVTKGASNATKNNYRKLYLEQFSDLPKGWQVHHTLPQKYETIMKNAEINIHEVQYLKGIDPKIHSKITNEWSKWNKKLGRTPTSQDILDFASTIDKKYGKYWHNQ